MVTPLILLTGYLGSGKTTLLQHVLRNNDGRRIAVLMNEFGEVGIDTKTIRKETIAIKELLEGCVCCSLLGEFRAGIQEIIRLYKPDLIIVETTGIAEADNLVLDVNKISGVKLVSVVTVVDCTLVVRFPSLGHNITLQIAAADVLVLGKVDLVSRQELTEVEKKVREINSTATLVTAVRGKVDLSQLIPSKRALKFFIQSIPDHGMESFSVPIKSINRAQLVAFLKQLPASIYRVKGYVLVGRSWYLVNYVGGRCTIERSGKQGESRLVFIGKDVKKVKGKVERMLNS